MPDIGGLQLLPETRKKIEVRIPGQNRPVILSSIFMLIILGLYLGLLFYNNSIRSSVTQADEELLTLERSRDKKLEQKLLDLKTQLAVISPLISSHFFWSQGLTKMQNLVEPQIQFKSMNADGSANKVLFQATAANYTAIAKQIAAFYTDESIKDIVLNRAAVLTTGDIDFTMQLGFDQSKFLIKLK